MEWGIVGQGGKGGSGIECDRIGWVKWDGKGKDGTRVDWQDGGGEDDFGWDGKHGENTIFTEKSKFTNEEQFIKLNIKYQNIQ